MKKLLIAATACILAIPALADNDCCFDIAAGANATCTQQANQTNCFARTGQQAWAVDFNCVANGNTVCQSKLVVGEECAIFGHVPQLECTISDLVLEGGSRAPAMSLTGMAVLVVLLGAGALWMLRRQSSAAA